MARQSCERIENLCYRACSKTIKGVVATFSQHFVVSGEGTPLLLLHGNGEDHTWFATQIPYLAQHYRVFAVDTRGHGLSARGTAPFTLSQFADDLCALMDRLCIPVADLLGFSDGGNIALLFALRYPNRVRRMILCGANLRPSGLKWFTLLTIDVQYLGYIFLGLFSLTYRQKKERFQLMATQPQIHVTALHALPHPTLVVAGTHDLIRSQHTRLIANELPNSRLLLLEGSHYVAQEQPERFTQAVFAFLSEPMPAVKPHQQADSIADRLSSSQ